MVSSSGQKTTPVGGDPFRLWFTVIRQGRKAAAGGDAVR